MKQPNRLPMSAELESMIAASAAKRKKSKAPTPTVRWISSRFASDGKERTVEFTNETYRQIRLIKAANKLLGRSGFFAKPEVSEEEFEYIPVDAFSITPSGYLRPTWQGRI